MNSQRGFTLIELAIVIALMGLLSAMGLQALKTQRINDGLAQTRERHKLAADSLRGFLAQERRLPCPADPALPPADPAYGAEGDCSSGQALFSGVLPYRALGLSRSASLDGWDRQMRYTVVAGAVGSGALHGAAWAPLLQTADQSGAVAALVSHGPNGSGAVTELGAALPAPPEGATLELENLDGDAVFGHGDYSEAPEAPFDDLVVLLSEQDLIGPLEAVGAVQGKAAWTRRQIDRADRWVLGHVASLQPLPDVLPDSPTDAWGQSLAYQPAAGGYEIWSLGADGQASTCGASEFCVYRSPQELLGLLLQAGIGLSE